MKNSDSSFDQLFDTFNSFLEQNRLKKTPERFAILRMIHEQTKPFEIKTINRKFILSKYYISRATLYNTIHLLEECDIIEKTFVDGKIMYQKKNKGASHILLSSEGKIAISLDEKIENMVIQWVEEHYDLNINHFDTIFYTEE